MYNRFGNNLVTPITDANEHNNFLNKEVTLSSRLTVIASLF